MVSAAAGGEAITEFPGKDALPPAALPAIALDGTKAIIRLRKTSSTQITPDWM